MLLKMQKSTDFEIPTGIYKTKFTNLESIETIKGSAYRWIFDVIEGEHAGRVISGLSDGGRPPTPKNKTGRWLNALSGGALGENMEINTNDYIAQKYMVVVEATENGNRMTTFSKV